MLLVFVFFLLSGCCIQNRAC